MRSHKITLISELRSHLKYFKVEVSVANNNKFRLP